MPLPTHSRPTVKHSTSITNNEHSPNNTTPTTTTATTQTLMNIHLSLTSASCGLAPCYGWSVPLSILLYYQHAKTRCVEMQHTQTINSASLAPKTTSNGRIATRFQIFKPHHSQSRYHKYFLFSNLPLVSNPSNDFEILRISACSYKFHGLTVLPHPPHLKHPE